MEKDHRLTFSVFVTKILIKKFKAFLEKCVGPTLSSLPTGYAAVCKNKK